MTAKIRFDRLRKVVQALREVPRSQKSKFTMDCYAHSCGTPACVLGHFAARRDLQREFSFSVPPFSETPTLQSRGYGLDPAYAAKNYFGLDEEDVEALFGGAGCGNAKTPIQAARYIERFIKQHEQEKSK